MNTIIKLVERVTKDNAESIINLTKGRVYFNDKHELSINDYGVEYSVDIGDYVISPNYELFYIYSESVYKQLAKEFKGIKTPEEDKYVKCLHCGQICSTDIDIEYSTIKDEKIVMFCPHCHRDKFEKVDMTETSSCR